MLELSLDKARQMNRAGIFILGGLWATSVIVDCFSGRTWKICHNCHIYKYTMMYQAEQNFTMFIIRTTCFDSYRIILRPF